MFSVLWLRRLSRSVGSIRGERSDVDMDLGYRRNFVSCLSQNVLIGLGQRSQVAILEVPERAQHLRRLAIEHALECSETCRKRHAGGDHSRDIDVVLRLGAV